MKKKVFPTILLIISIIQFGLWGLFVFCDEFIATDFAVISGIVFLIISVVIYFAIENKLIKKLDITRIKFTINALIIWNVLNIIIAIPLNVLVDKGILSYCSGGGWGCFLNGIEYLIFPILVAIASLVILFCKLIFLIYKKLKNNKKK